MSARIGAIWVRKMKDGSNYLSGTLSQGVHGDDISIVAFPNKEKTKDTQPDFIVTLSKPRDASARVQPATVEPPSSPANDLGTDDINLDNIPL